MMIRELVLLLTITGSSRAVRVIGGNVTALQGETVTFACVLTDSTQHLSQISWQRTTRKKPLINNFFTILERTGPTFINGHDHRFNFSGNFEARNGSLQLSNVMLMDEGIYTCIYTLFPDGNFQTEIWLDVQVPPDTYVKSNHPMLADEEVLLGTCTAACSRPPAEVKWLTDPLAEKLSSTTNSSQHANGTTTTVSNLLGVPTKDINRRLVHCVITTPALSKEKRIPFTIDVQYSPKIVNMTEKSKDSFQCVAEASPIAQITWSRSGQSWPLSNVAVQGETLHFLAMSSDLTGLYQCEASNIHGSDRSYIFVRSASGPCTACWTILGLLISLIIVAAALFGLHKTGILTRLTHNPFVRTPNAAI